MNQKIGRIRQILVVLLLIAAIEGFSSCEKYSYTERPVDPNTTWHFQTDIQPIFNGICITCHGGVQAPDLRAGKSYAALTKGGYVKSPGETSILYIQITTQSDHIPRTTSAEKFKILYWINQGALNN
jgi:type 1 glutamine amidotransferase